MLPRIKEKILFFSLLAFSLSLFSPCPLNAEDYSFRDAFGEEVRLPLGKAIYSRKHPGPWAGLHEIHEPQIQSSFRKVGLEDVRVLKINFSHPSTEKDGRIEKIYLSDKDGLVVGYKVLEAKDLPVNLEFKVNGVINYIKIYVECSRHGLWGVEMRL